MDDSHSKLFCAIDEPLPDTKWADFFRTHWGAYRKWFLSGGDAARPSYLRSHQALSRYMPELMPTYERLVDLAGGSDTAARFLSLYQPPAYLSGCTQAVWTGDEPVLVRNYDYSAERTEGVLLKTRWNGQAVIGMSDATWGILDGMNESGLAVSLAFGGRVEVGEGFGIPLILRYILEFGRDTQDAIEVLRRVPTHMSYNVTIVDREQRFATVYVTPDRPCVVRQVPVATNHQGRIEWPRHAWATATLERETEANRILSNIDQTDLGLIDGFLRPPIYNRAHHRGFGTLYTAVYRPVSRSIAYCWPGHQWVQGFDHFTELTEVIQYPGG